MRKICTLAVAVALFGLLVPSATLAGEKSVRDFKYPTSPEKAEHRKAEGIIKSVTFREGMSMVTLENGTDLTLPASVVDVKREALKPGATVMATYGEAKAGQKIVTAIDVLPAETTDHRKAKGTIRAVTLRDGSRFLTLQDGTELTIPEFVPVDRSTLKPGANVKATYREAQAGQKIVTTIEVQ